ncbi:MAG: NAD(+) synthase [Eggerthellaceae bacterium]|jgi:NAD+ synthase (glutamine-hydrolysing)|nr:NAD(+) synthase [Eggerthellaceae bacterium]MDR2715807.1 NAD(+) synthase [Coriobacteriaceae bacterium]
MENEATWQACVQGLEGYVGQAGFSEVVIGLSGGIDSALAAVACVDALGADAVHGVMLPGPYSSGHALRDAQELAENLGIRTLTIPIVGPFEAFRQAFADAGQTVEGVAAENTQARCRMVCLMALSNTHGWLLVNTGNKSESLVGYSTLYGDMAGAFAPLGGLYKTQVYELARWRNAAEEAQGHPLLIPQATIEKAPSAELSPGQTDEEGLGMAYPALDRILKALVEDGQGVEELCAQGHAEEEVQRIAALVKANAFKHTLIPPSPEVPK